MIETADDTDHSTASRFKTVAAESKDQKQGCDLVRKMVREQQGLRQTRTVTNSKYEQQLLVFNRTSGLPVATMGLCPSNIGGEVEGEFDLRGLMQNNPDYLELDGPVILPGHNPDEILDQCLEFIRENHACNMPEVLVSRISLPLGGGDKYIQSLMFYLRNSHMCTNLARPRVPLRRGDVAYADDVILPGILRAFLRRGACIGSEPYWDAEQGRAVILVWLEKERLFYQPFQPKLGTNCCAEPQLFA